MRRARLIYEARNRPGADPRVIAELRIPDDVTDAEMVYALRQGIVRHEAFEEQPAAAATEPAPAATEPAPAPTRKKRRKKSKA